MYYHIFFSFQLKYLIYPVCGLSGTILKHKVLPAHWSVSKYIAQGYQTLLMCRVCTDQAALKKSSADREACKIQHANIGCKYPRDGCVYFALTNL